VRYEDLTMHPEREVRRIAAFLDIAADDALIRRTGESDNPTTTLLCFFTVGCRRLNAWVHAARKAPALNMVSLMPWGVVADSTH
jgi:hypothetical protein